MFKSNISNIKYIEVLMQQCWPKSEFALVNSAWLTVGGLKENSDLDIIISSKLRKKIFNGKGINQTIGINGPYEKRVRIHPENSDYGYFYNCNGIDELIYNHTVTIGEVKFVELKFFLMYKKVRLHKLLNIKKDRNYLIKISGLLLSQNRILKKKINRDINDLEFFRELLVTGNNFYSDNFTSDSLDYPNMLWKLD